MNNINANTPWGGPRLLIPMTVEGLVVTDASNATEYSINSLPLGNYNSYGNISLPLFTATGMPSAGIYLNWALPDGMTHGLMDSATGSTVYPYLPNRWMVIRFSSDSKIPTHSWIVESDWQGTTSNAYGNAQPQIITAGEGGNASIQYIGKSYDLGTGTWTEAGQNAALYLTAVGNSDPLFAAYAGSTAMVYSFYDPFTDVNATFLKNGVDANTKQPQASYLVCGWYSNPAYDVLYDVPPPVVNSCGKANGWTTEQGWLDLMTQLQWSVGSETINNNPDLTNAMQAAQNWLAAQGITPLPGLEGTLCAQSLCHGALLGVQWPGLKTEPPSNVPVYNTDPSTAPYVSAGNSATDCLAAFMQWQLNYNNTNPNPADADVEIMLEAFANKMLPQPGGLMDTPDLMNAIQQSWYGRMPGGTVWVAQAPKTAGTPQPGQQQPPPVLPAALAQQLASLNESQATSDSFYRQLITQQKELYASWLKNNIYNNLDFPPQGVTQQQLTADLATALAAVQVTQAQYNSAQTAATAAATALTAALAADGNFTLLKNPAPDFHTPGDPVLMVNNAHRSYKRGEDIIYTEDDDFLFVRFTGQFISSLQVTTSSGNVTVQGSALAPSITLPATVPGEVTPLLAEACLLDMNFATLIAQKAGISSPTAAQITTIQSQQTLIWNTSVDDNGLYTAALDNRTLEQVSGFNPGDTLFHVPSKIGVWQWAQPWNPLYLEWEVTYFPAADPTLSQWQFNGSDYNWTGGAYPPGTAGNGIVYKGRSILTPKEAITMQARLQEFINDYQGTLPSDYIPLQDVINGIGNWDVLSQTLTGFTLQLLQWDIEQFGYQPTDATYGPAIGNEGHGMPVPNDATQFFPVRAGFVQINHLWIVDDYGQVFDINPPQSVGGPPLPLNPIPGIGVEPGSYQIQEQLPNYFQLPPRVIQGTRLNFNFVSAASDSTLSSLVPGTTPVCGWIVPNHPDNSVMVYDNTGALLGEIMVMGESLTPHAQWVAAPLGGVSSINISNTHLKGFVQGLLGTTTSDTGTVWSGQALINFMATIDETLWSVDPLGERDNQSLSILVGRPIAVLRASLQLESFGNPAYNLGWTATGQNDTGGISNYKFPVQVGNISLYQDGVMGYFTGDNYSTFNSVHQGEVTTPASPAYVVNNFTNLSISVPGAQVMPTYITLLLDPRGSIHTSSGILPVLETDLPEIYVGNALDNMLIEFRTGPLLVDTQTWGFPLPAGAGTQWSWLQPGQQSGSTVWSEVAGLVASNPVAQLPLTPPVLKEGRLKLAGALGSELMIFFFQVNGQTLPYSAPLNTAVQLSWSSQGAVSATLTVGTAAPVTVPANTSAYSYTVASTQSLTLTVKDASNNTQSLTIKIAVA